MNADLRATIGREEFDYPALMSALVDYARPRGRVTALLRRGEIVGVAGVPSTPSSLRWRRACVSSELSKVAMS